MKSTRVKTKCANWCPAKITPEKLKRLKALNERLHGSLPNFMTQEDLKIMREDAKWEAIK